MRKTKDLRVNLGVVHSRFLYLLEIYESPGGLAAFAVGLASSGFWPGREARILRFILSSESTMVGWTSKLTESLFSWIQWPSRAATRHVLIGVLLGFSFSITSTSIAVFFQRRKKERQLQQFTLRPIELRSDEIVSGVSGLIGTHSVVPFFEQAPHYTRRKHAPGQNQLAERCTWCRNSWQSRGLRHVNFSLMDGH